MQRALDLIEELEEVLSEVPSTTDVPLVAAQVRTIGREIHVAHCELDEIVAKPR